MYACVCGGMSVCVWGGCAAKEWMIDGYSLEIILYITYNPHIVLPASLYKSQKW